MSEVDGEREKMYEKLLHETKKLINHLLVVLKH